MALARADVWADAISAGGWAAVTGQPVLLTATGSLHPAVAAWLATHPDRAVTALGGTAALADQVVADANATRVSGPNRYATAVAITGLWPNDATGHVIANGTADDAWAYTVAAAGLAADRDQLIPLVDTARLPAETNDHLCATGDRAATTVIGPDRLVDQTFRDLVTAPC